MRQINHPCLVKLVGANLDIKPFLLTEFLEHKDVETLVQGSIKFYKVFEHCASILSFIFYIFYLGVVSSCVVCGLVVVRFARFGSGFFAALISLHFPDGWSRKGGKQFASQDSAGKCSSVESREACVT